MNLEYIKNYIIPQREKEIKEWKNAGTRDPIYIIYDLEKHYIEAETDEYWLETTNLKWKKPKYWKIVGEDEKEFIEIEDEDVDTIEFYTDRLVAIFFTRKSAEDYLIYQKHNLSSEAYIYVQYPWYSNQEANMLFKKE